MRLTELYPLVSYPRLAHFDAAGVGAIALGLGGERHREPTQRPTGAARRHPARKGTSSATIIKPGNEGLSYPQPRTVAPGTGNRCSVFYAHSQCAGVSTLRDCHASDHAFGCCRRCVHVRHARCGRLCGERKCRHQGGETCGRDRSERRCALIDQQTSPAYSGRSARRRA